MPYDGIVLAGGGSVRLGQDKTRVKVAGRAALDRVLTALAGAGQVVVVGPRRPVHAPGVALRWTREDPPGGGPAAGVAAAVTLVRQPWVVVLAGDLPLVSTATVGRLLDLATVDSAAGGAVLVDADGRRQHLTVALRTARLRERAAQRDWRGAAMWSLLDGLVLVEVPAVGSETLDLDEPDDVDVVRHLDVDVVRQPAVDVLGDRDAGAGSGQEDQT